MLSNYVNTALRSLLKSKTHSFINIFGLAFGIACVFLIILYVQRELSYDRFHKNAQNLYRITWEDANPQTRTPHPMAQALKADFPEVAAAVSLTPLFAAGLTKETHSFRNVNNDTRYDEKNILAVDTTFFDVFSFPLVKGNSETALKQVDGVLISESMAGKYFPGEEPLGQHLAVDAEGYLMEVVGVFKDVPINSHFHFDFLVSYMREKSYDSLDAFYSWADFGHYNYVRLHGDADPKVLESKLMQWIRKYIDARDVDYETLIGQGYGFRLQPVTDIHLHSRLRWELEPNGNIEYVYILSVAALLTLTIATLNFMNLTTAKSTERAKEIVVRKALGAAQHQLSLQFLAESILMALIAIVIAVMIVEVALPIFNALTGLAFEIDYNQHGVMLLALGLLIGTVSGLYPSFYLSTIRPHLVLKGRMIQTPGGVRVRNGLIMFQFFMSTVLVSSAILIYNQLNFISKKNLGFSTEAVLVVPVKNESGMDRFEVLQNELKEIDGVLSVSASSNLPGGQFNQHHIASMEFPDEDIAVSEAFVDYDFFNVLDISLAEGRFFSRGSGADSSHAYILNETAVRQLNLKGSAVGKEIWWKQREENIMRRGTIIGVVKDFHFQSLHEPIRPLLFAFTKHQFNHIVIRLETEDIKNRITAIEKTYKAFEPVYGFEFAYLEDRLNVQYASERQTGLIMGIFTMIAILIACFGLFAISLLTFQQKTKELSVRKVLGATLWNLMILFVGNFAKLIIVAVILATPFAWWMMHNWLQNFSYQISVNPFVFVLSGLVLLSVAAVTLSYFTVRAYRLNPAETLKNE